MKKFDFTIRGTKYNVNIEEVEGNMAKIEVNGTKYNVELNREIQQQKTPTLTRKKVVRKPGEGQITKGAAGYTVKAPLPGSIFKLLVSEGDTIVKGDNLLIMEAMKMENNVLAEKPGVIKSIKISEGDAVLQNDVLIEME